MAKKSNNYLWLGLAAVVAFFAFKKPDATPAGGSSAGNGNGGTGTGSGNGGTGNGSGGTPTYFYPIFWNRFHPDVKLLQQTLGNVNVDGYIGRETSGELAKYGIVFNQLSQIPNSTALQIYIQTINAIKNASGGSSVFLDRNAVGCIC